MDPTRFLGFIGIVLAGGVLMAFVFEFLNSERVEARKERRVAKEGDAASMTALPAFFAKVPTDAPLRATPGLDEALIALIEEHVKAEQAMVTRFVHYPSFDSLYRQAKPSPTLH